MLNAHSPFGAPYFKKLSQMSEPLIRPHNCSIVLIGGKTTLTPDLLQQGGDPGAVWFMTVINSLW